MHTISKHSVAMPSTGVLGAYRLSIILVLILPSFNFRVLWSCDPLVCLFLLFYDAREWTGVCFGLALGPGLWHIGAIVHAPFVAGFVGKDAETGKVGESSVV